ncbi:Glucose oxidase 2 [Phlyctema vagabunda]|uniref:Glucose oxidase 2 n=1 Tax=Phlyctema vagabunda TaxID=108571 RepID=A0ABR4PC97_9HELO
MSPLVPSALAALALLDISSAIPTVFNRTQSYDYVIVGGGTCGLVIANRLTELANVTVAIVEAGDSVLNNANVTDVLGYGKAFGTDIDYAYETVEQVYADNAKVELRAAKALGGTSTINGMAYTRAPKAQIDSWEAVGNEGWNWESLWPYYLKHEKFQVPKDFQIANGADYVTAYHGVDGPVRIGWENGVINGTIFDSFNATHDAVGIPYNADMNGGDMRGFYFLPKFIDQANNSRVDAATAYYYPVQDRTNLNLFTNTHVNKVIWNSTDGEAIAGGIEVTASDGTVSHIYAKKEVIISAGSLRTPVVLELSGIGNPDILSQYDIDVVVDLPTVGENLQEQTNNAMFWDTNEDQSGVSSFVTYPTASDIFGSNTSVVANDIQAALTSYAEIVADASGNATKAADLLSFFQVQYDLVFKSEVPVTEIYTTVQNAIFNIEFWGLLPFSRGSVHLGSADPTGKSLINPNYFMLDWDRQLQIASGKFLRDSIAVAEPVVGLIANATSPSVSTLATDADDAAWLNWIVAEYRPNFHPVGTAAMLPTEVGGVVSNKLIVYGTSNLRVVDASVLPFQVCGHLTSTLYAVAEKAADIIKADL